MPATNCSAATTARSCSRRSPPRRPKGSSAVAEAVRRKFSQPAVTPELVASHGLNSDEYRKIVEFLGREPNYTELGVFSVMWSEHCSYKSSRYYLKNLPTEGRHVLQGPG